MKYPSKGNMAPTVGATGNWQWSVNHLSFLQSYFSMENGRECSMLISCLSEVVENQTCMVEMGSGGYFVLCFR